MLKSMEIPFFDAKRVDRKREKSIINAVKRVIESGRYILDKEVKDFENEFSKFIGARFSVGVASGTDALLLSLVSLNAKGKRVITTPFTFISTAEVILRAGGIPVFIDIEEDGFLMDLAQIPSQIDKKTSAIIPVHLFGEMVDIKKIKNIAKDIPVIEDCAQAFGSFINKDKAGSSGYSGCFSFFPTKGLGGYGDGGMITTNSSSLYKKLLALRRHGKVNGKYEFIGYNSRLDEIQAAILLTKMKSFDEDIQKRQKIAKRYIQALKDFVKVPKYNPGHSFHQFTIRVEKRDKLKDFLKMNGIQTRIYYPIPLHLHPIFSYKKGAFPNSEKRAKEVLSLPIFPGLTEEEIEYIIHQIRRFFEK